MEGEDLQQLQERDEQNNQDAVDPERQREDVEVQDWLEEEEEDDDDEPDEEMEIEAIFLFVEDVMRYCLMYWNIEWEAPDHRYEERFYANRTTYFSVIIGQAVVHYCVRDFCVGRIRGSPLRSDQWTDWPHHLARFEIRRLIESFMTILPIPEHRRSIAILSLGGVLCEMAMKRDQSLLVDGVVQEIVATLYNRIPSKNYYSGFSTICGVYVMRHRELHRRSRDGGFIEGPIDIRELLD